MRVLVEDSEKKRVSLMGPPRVTAWVRQAGGRVREEPQRISQDAEVMDLLALLLLTRRFVTHEDAKDGGEVRRDWLLRWVTPKPNATPKQTRDGLIYFLGKLDERLKISAYGGKREMGVFKMTLEHLSVDVLELAEAAKHPHVPANQEKVIALGDRPLLEGMAYPWFQEPPFQRVRVELDTYFLTALARQADSQIVQKESANEAGRQADADACRTKALPLLDKAAERLHGYGKRLRRPEYAELLPLKAQFSDLRRRAAYPLPEEAAPVAAPLSSRILSPITSFVGRSREKQRVKSLLATQRLVTLTGMGGCGKTRLALEVAADMEEGGEYDVCPVELASLGDAALLPQTVARTLGLEVKENFVEALVARFQGKPTLLLLDNCEHLIQACAGLVETLLQACPELTVLATSREALKIDGEHPCPVPPLGVPDPDRLPTDAPDPVAALLRHDAAHLFLDRVRPHREFTLGPDDVRVVAVICASLDGIPLALELAAARVKLLPLVDIAEMLRDSFHLLTDGRRTALPRHKTLRAVIDWSYDLLTEPERMLLCRLSVFRGGWTLASAEAVGTPEGGISGDVLDLLTSLVDKSLVVADTEAAPGRYRMLETVRQYGGDRLRERGEWQETRHRHRNFYSSLAEEAYLHLMASDQQQWLDRLETEVNNLRAALTCYQESGEAEEEWVWLTARLWFFWWVRGYLSEGMSRSQEALTQAKDVSDSTRALALEGAGNLAYHLGDYSIARSLLEQGLELMRGNGTEKGIARILVSLGGLALGTSEIAEAGGRFQEALEIFRQMNDERCIPISLVNLGAVANFQKDYPLARSLYSECLERFRRLEDGRNVAHTLYCLGNIEIDEGNTVEAERLLRESLGMFRGWKEQWRCIIVLETFMSLEAAKGQHQRACRLWGAAQASRQQLESPLQPEHLAQYGQILSKVQEAMGAEAFETALAEGRAMSWEQAVAYALEEDSP